MLFTIVDNSGGLIANLIRPLNQGKGVVGDKVKVSIRKALPNRKVKKGEIYDALIVRTRQPISRADGSLLRFGENSVVLLTTEGLPIGTRLAGPFPFELLLHSKLRPLISEFL